MGEAASGPDDPLSFAYLAVTLIDSGRPIRSTVYSYLTLPTSQRQRLVDMLAGTRNHLDPGILPLWNAVFCLDCEVISAGRGNECAACKSRSLVSLARMLEGSLLTHRAQHLQGREGGLFDITITIELQQMHAKTLSTTVERLTSVIGPRLVLDRASFHINVQPAGNKLDLQPSLSFPEREAA
jgi:hypothetical protein